MPIRIPESKPFALRKRIHPSMYRRSKRIVAVRDVLDSIGHSCPGVPAGLHPPRSADDQFVAMEIFFS